MHRHGLPDLCPRNARSSSPFLLAMTIQMGLDKGPYRGERASWWSSLFSKMRKWPRNGKIHMVFFFSCSKITTGGNLKALEIEIEFHCQILPPKYILLCHMVDPGLRVTWMCFMQAAGVSGGKLTVTGITCVASRPEACNQGGFLYNLLHSEPRR